MAPYRFIAPLIAMLLGIAAPGARADWWVNAGTTGYWDDGANWNTGLAPAGVGEVILNATAIITNSPPNQPLTEIWCGNNGLGNNRIDVLGANIQISNWLEIDRRWGSGDAGRTTNILNVVNGNLSGNFNCEIGWEDAGGGSGLGVLTLSNNSTLVTGGFLDLGSMYTSGSGAQGVVVVADNAQLIWGQNGNGANIGLNSGSTGIVYQSGNSLVRHRFSGGTGWWVNLGGNAGSYGEYNLSGGTMEMYTGDVYSFSGDGFNVGSSGTGVFNVTNGAAHLRDLIVSKWNGSRGTVNQVGGTVDVGLLVAANGDARVGGFGGSTNTLGVYNLSDGTFYCAPNLMIGADGTGVWYQVGGVATSAVWTVAGRFGTAALGTITVAGGVFDKGPANGTHLNIGEDGTGILTVTNTGLVRMHENLYVGMNAGSSGTVNLDGGTIETPGVGQGARNGTATFNFNGGTLLANAGNGTFMEGLSAAYVRAGGAVVDTAGNGIGIRQNLLDGGGNGGLAKWGTGSLDLGGTSTFTGKVRIHQGMLRAGSAAALGAEPAGYVADQITLDGTTLGNWDSQVNLSANRGITLTATGGYLQAGWSGNPANGVTVNGHITGPGGLGINQDGAPVVLASTLNNYAGDTTVGAEGPGWWNDGGAFSVLVLGNSEVIPHGIGKGNLNIVPDHSGGGQPAFLDMNGFSETVNGLTGSGYITNRSDTTLSTLTVGGNNASSVYAGSIQGGGGDIALAKTGTGTFTLAGANTYGGGTIVDRGTLLVNNASASGTGTGGVTVNAGGTLGGTGRLDGAVTVSSGGTLAPGNSIGTNDIGGLTFESGATFRVEVSGAEADQTISEGAAELGGATLTVVQLGNVTFASARILSNPTGEINGEFAGRPEDSVVFTNSSGAAVYRIHYQATYVALDRSPFVVALARFGAMAEGDHTVVRWQTASEVGTTGFDLYRMVNGTWVKVNDAPIPATGAPLGGQGAWYTLSDAGAAAGGTYDYKVVEFTSEGDAIDHGPYSRTASAFELRTPTRTPPTGMVIRWLSRTDEVYRVWCSTNLVDSAPQVLGEAIKSTPPQNVLLDTNPAPLKAYWVELQ